jgi:hypothetical protein
VRTGLTRAAQLEQNFRPDMTDTDAGLYFQGLIMESLSSVMPRVMEFFHKVAQQMRS